MNWIRKNWPFLAIYNIYAVGIIGFIVADLQDLFASLTWASLIISFCLLLYCHKESELSFWVSIAAIGLLGYFLEVIGVRTGVLFGEYTYGNALGLKILDVPVMIAVNWIVLVYLASYIAKRIFKHSLLIVVFGALLMTGLDVLIEPFAMSFDLWSWAQEHVPMQNYIMWFVISLVMQYIFLKFNPKVTNRLVIPLAACLALFFLIIDLVVIW